MQIVLSTAARMSMPKMKNGQTALMHASKDQSNIKPSSSLPVFEAGTDDRSFRPVHDSGYCRHGTETTSSFDGAYHRFPIFSP